MHDWPQLRNFAALASCARRLQTRAGYDLSAGGLCRTPATPGVPARPVGVAPQFAGRRLTRQVRRNGTGASNRHRVTGGARTVLAGVHDLRAREPERDARHRRANGDVSAPRPVLAPCHCRNRPADRRGRCRARHGVGLLGKSEIAVTRQVSVLQSAIARKRSGNSDRLLRPVHVSDRASGAAV